MEMPLTPMDFARRARRLYADREAVVDGDLRLTYVQFLERCNRGRQHSRLSELDRAIVSPTSPRTPTPIWRHIILFPRSARYLSQSIIDCSRTSSSTSSTILTQRSFALTLI